jgi:sigma-B regulation protein RsbU (phosphoserine phosphatase)
VAESGHHAQLHGWRHRHHADTIVVYSDGVTDANDPGGGDFGIERLMVAARHLGSRPTQDVAAGLLESVSDFWATAGPNDVATVAAFRYRPES